MGFQERDQAGGELILIYVTSPMDATSTSADFHIPTMFRLYQHWLNHLQVGCDALRSKEQLRTVIGAELEFRLERAK